MDCQVPEPDLPIIDPHHHLYASNHWVQGGGPYLLPEFAVDLASGHNVVATVYVECSQLYRTTGPQHLRLTGEAEFAAVIGRLSDTGHFGKAKVCEGYIGYAPLELGEPVEEVLEALEEASDGRLRGIRCPTNWDPDPAINASTRPYAAEGLMRDPGFRAGVARLAANGLVYEAWQFHPQLPDLADLADAVPDTTVACCHCGGLLGRGRYADAGNFAHWRANILELAKRPNVVMKLGGLSNNRTGFGFHNRAVPVSEAEMVVTWGPYIETCIEAFGADRCMFESNFPVEMGATDYRTLWTVFKKIVAAASSHEKAQLFAGTARRVYRLS